ncbi:MAG: RsmD family RNA methyltransferase [Candidatus Heimdallarchaeota archaeon]|nr:MAG: RsmD family RNA methyltransferase [Candidatus Heimdallarchaeota archaeon]
MRKQKEPEGGYFFLLSGENPELAVYEFKSIISTLDSPIELRVSPDNRVIVLLANISLDESFNSDIIPYLMKRVTLVHFCAVLLYQTEYLGKPPETFYELISSFDISRIQELTPNQSFSVISKRIGEPKGILCQLNLTQEFSRYLGTQILKKNPSKRVNLENPKEQFVTVLSNQGLWFGQFVSYSLRSEVRSRRARLRPFFHPSSMNPILQRTMVNLGAVRADEWLLDPFCGTGGALIEAAQLGIKSVGIEIDRKIIWGAYQNLKKYEFFNYSPHLVFGDATQLCLKKGMVSAIVTDPPYGTAASTRGFDLKDLLLTFFQEIRSILRPNNRVVMAVPSDVDIEGQAAHILNATYKTFFQYVHRSLTRKIIVFIIIK